MTALTLLGVWVLVVFASLIHEQLNTIIDRMEQK